MPTKLPVFATIRTAIVDAFRVVQSMPAAIGLLFCAFLAMNFSAQAMTPDPLNVRLDFALFYSSVATSILFSLVAAPVAVLIHRWIILGEDTGLGSAPGLVGEIVRFYLVLIVARILTKLIILPAAIDEDSGAMVFVGLIVWISAIPVRQADDGLPGDRGRRGAQSDPVRLAGVERRLLAHRRDLDAGRPAPASRFQGAGPAGEDGDAAGPTGRPVAANRGIDGLAGGFDRDCIAHLSLQDGRENVAARTRSRQTPQCARAVTNSTTSISACASGRSWNSPSASRAIAP
ncbi:hypothetical protein [Methylopila sp. M107]|uniref:hypothetical protein n=1 Tax=Methylopila sp. M107 TaxID=1101190 RepID=UPI0012DE99C4|nr:hypothetical protein [Methylopila sp. M107]